MAETRQLAGLLELAADHRRIGQPRGDIAKQIGGMGWQAQQHRRAKQHATQQLAAVHGVIPSFSSSTGGQTYSISCVSMSTATWIE
ncbi:hypothetical protein EPAKOI_003733 [Cupriavidus sp. H18C2]